MHMEPVIAPFMTGVSFGLGYFICMVREHIVNASAVNIHVFAQMLHADA